MKKNCLALAFVSMLSPLPCNALYQNKTITAWEPNREKPLWQSLATFGTICGGAWLTWKLIEYICTDWPLRNLSKKELEALALDRCYCLELEYKKIIAARENTTPECLLVPLVKEILGNEQKVTYPLITLKKRIGNNRKELEAILKHLTRCSDENTAALTLTENLLSKLATLEESITYLEDYKKESLQLFQEIKKSNKELDTHRARFQK